MSVISAKNLTVSSCVFSNTTGTAPRAGIDFEPNGWTDALFGIQLSRCLAAGNGGSGFGISVSALSNESLPIDVDFDQSVARDSYVGSGVTSITFRDHADTQPRGRFAFRNGAVVHTKNPGVSVTTPWDRIKVSLENTSITDTAYAHEYWTPIEVAQSRAGPNRTWQSGGLSMSNVTIGDPGAAHASPGSPTRPYIHVCDECKSVSMGGGSLVQVRCEQGQAPNCTAQVDGVGSWSSRDIRLDYRCGCVGSGTSFS